MNVNDLNLDVSKQPAVTPVLYLGQGDKNGTTLQASIYDDGSPLPLAGKSVRFAMRSPNVQAYYEVNGTVSGNVATFQINEEYAASIAGTTDVAYVEVLEGSTVVCSTNRFRVVVLESAQDGADPEQAYSNGIMEAIDDAHDAAADARDAAEEAREAAGGTIPLMSPIQRGGAKVGSGLHMNGEALNLGPLTDSGSGASVQTDGVGIFGVTGEGWSEQDTTTGKNLCPRMPSQTVNGVTFTANPDGSVTANGTATSQVVLNVQSMTSYDFTTPMVLSGAPSGSSSNTYCLLVTYYDSNGSWENESYDIGNGTLLYSDYAQYSIAYLVRSGTVLNNVTFYPQLEQGSTATSYEPYTGGKASPNPDYPQEIRVARGRNLINPAKVQSVGPYSFGGWTASSQYRSFWTPCVPDQVFTLSRENTANGNIGLNFYASEPDPSVGNNPAYAPLDGYNFSDGTTITRIAPAGSKYVFVMLGNNVSSSFSVDGYQLELGTQATPYVPYGYVGLEVAGRNLLDESKRTNDKYLNDSGTPTDASGCCYSDYIPVKSGSYIFNGHFGGTSESVNFRVQTYNSSKAFVAQVVKKLTYSGDDVSETFTVGSGVAYIRVSYAMSYSQSQLETGSTATDYEPYIHTATPIPLPANGFAGALPDGTKDTLAIDSAGRVEWVNACNEVVFDGSSDEIWDVYNFTHGLGYYTSAINSATKIDAAVNTTRCSSFIMSGSNATSYSGNCYIDNSRRPCFIIPSITDVSAWRSYLASQPMTLLYTLATPTTESMGYIQLPELPAGATVSIPELEAIGVEWWVEGAEAIAEHGRDVSKANKEQEDRIAELEAAVANLATS